MSEARGSRSQRPRTGSPQLAERREAENDNARQIGGDDPEAGRQPDERVAHRPDMGRREQQLANAMTPVAPGHPGACSGCQRAGKNQVVAHEHAVMGPENDAQRQVITGQQPGGADDQRGQPEGDAPPRLYPEQP